MLTTGALSSLDGGKLDAVLAHERAHLSGRHHLVLRLAAALERSFPGVRFFAVASYAALATVTALAVTAFVLAFSTIIRCPRGHFSW